MTKPPTCRVRLVLTNPKCLRALACICETMNEAVEDLLWRDDIRRAAKATKYLVRHLGLMDVEDADA